MMDKKMKLLDCTIRDGGLLNNSRFSDEFVRSVYSAVCASGIDYVELGYRNSKEMFSEDEFGKWRFCDEEDLLRVTDGIEKGNTKISVMQDAHKADAADLLPKSESVVDMIRIATYAHDMNKAVDIADAAVSKGYECTINVMAISTVPDRELERVLPLLLPNTGILSVYIVDSYGALTGKDVQRLFSKYSELLPGKEIGIHFHNNLQLAFANNIEGINLGATYVDGTLYGMGRGAGNCPMELLIGWLRDPKYKVEPLLEVVHDQIIPHLEKIHWGYHSSFMLSGLMNQHPRDAMKWIENNNTDFMEFYKNITGK